MQFQIHRRTFAGYRRSPRRGRARQPWYALFVEALTSDRARFVALISFMALVAFTGGGSRADIPSLVVLRPAAVLFFIYASCHLTRERFREVKIPFLAVTALMLLALLQLVPLPAGIWTALPQRELVAETSRLVGMEGVLRPLSLDPNRTWNTFFALFVPLSAIALVAIQGESQRRLVIPLLLAVGLLSAITGVFQAIGGDGLQLYEITHRGYPVGLFANKNHQSIMLLWLMLAGSWLAASADTRHRSPKAAVGGALALILVLFPLLVLTGSRAGLLLSVPVLAICGWLLLRSAAMEIVLRRAAGRAKLVVGGISMVLVVPLLFVFGVLAVSGRQTALSRLFEVDAAEELRWHYLPIFGRMALDFLPLGAGLGAFENVFDMYEPTETLSSRYLNQAHNDPVQLVIEGGVPALAILIVVLAWLARGIWRIWQSQQALGSRLAVFFGGSIALWLAASVVDYPLRTPLAAMLVATLTAQLSFLSTRLRPDRAATGK